MLSCRFLTKTYMTSWATTYTLIVEKAFPLSRKSWRKHKISLTEHWKGTILFTPFFKDSPFIDIKWASRRGSCTLYSMHDQWMQTCCIQIPPLMGQAQRASCLGEGGKFALTPIEISAISGSPPEDRVSTPHTGGFLWTVDLPLCLKSLEGELLWGINDCVTPHDQTHQLMQLKGACAPLSIDVFTNIRCPLMKLRKWFRANHTASNSNCVFSDGQTAGHWGRAGATQEKR